MILHICIALLQELLDISKLINNKKPLLAKAQQSEGHKQANIHNQSKANSSWNMPHSSTQLLVSHNKVYLNFVSIRQWPWHDILP
jgi:hypothetical protein